MLTTTVSTPGAPRGRSYSEPVARTKSTARSERSERDRRLDAMRREQAGRERRRRLALIIGAAVLALVLVGTVALTLVRQQQALDPDNIGVDATAAACQPVEAVPAATAGEHVGPGTSTPDRTTVEYEQVPAVSGPHYVSPVTPAAPFYTADDRPAVEQLVHNLEHGYTIAWYSSALPAEQVTALEEASEAMRREADTQNGKFIAAPWDEARGPLPGGTALSLAHWGAEDGAVQHCGAVSGAVIADFVAAHPASDSPEPNAA